MSRTDNYFTFPLSILCGVSQNTTARDCLELAVDKGVVNAGIGFAHRCEKLQFEKKFYEVCEDDYGIPEEMQPDPQSLAAKYLVGAKLCGVNLPGYYDFEGSAASTRPLKCEGQPLIRISSQSLWAAVEQARFDENPSKYDRPTRGLSWREFRVLAAILSWPQTSKEFTWMSNASIAFRSCGFVNKSDFSKAKRIPDHLPKLSPKQITTTLDTLENLGMFARFRMSTGSRGGRMAYSFKHTREELGEVVCDRVNFQDRAKIAQNRNEDLEKCLQNLERVKSKQTQEEVEEMAGKGRGKAGDKP